MNSNLVFDFLTLRVSQKRFIRQELGFGEQFPHENDHAYDARFLTFVNHEGKIRVFETLVIEQTKRR